MTAVIRQLAVGQMQNFSYVIGDPATKQAAIIDPGWEAPRLLQECENNGLTATMVILTHTHFDHVTALKTLCSLAPLQIYVHAAEISQIPAVAPIHTTQDGSVIQLGEVQVRCMHTPGHSPGGQCLLIDTACFTGDSLFVDGCGRVDLPGSDPAAMWQSLQRLAALPPDTVMYPGHDYGPTPTSTIGAQLISNPYLSQTTKTGFFHARGVQ